MTEIKGGIFLTAVMIILVIFFVSYGFAFSGKCIRVTDGDTIVVLADNKKIKIRLYGVDCPEMKQKYGKQARQFTSSHAKGKTVQVKQKGESYNRIVGIVHADDLCLNSELLKSGHAWYSSKYCRETVCTAWKAYELTAKRMGRGLWSDPDPVPPWEFRAGKTGKSIRNNNGIFSGSITSKKFHCKGCKYFNCQQCSAIFKTSEDAVRKGFAPCGICRP